MQDLAPSLTHLISDNHRPPKPPFISIGCHPFNQPQKPLTSPLCEERSTSTGTGVLLQKDLLLYPGAREVPDLVPELSGVVCKHSLAFFYGTKKKTK